MSDDKTVKCKLLRSTMVLCVSGTGEASLTATVWNHKHFIQTIFSTAKIADCRIDALRKEERSGFWVDSTCFAITRVDGEKLAKVFGIRLEKGLAP